MTQATAVFSFSLSNNYSISVNGSDPVAIADVSTAIPLVYPDDTISKVVAALVLYAVVFRCAESITTRYPQLLGEDVSAKTKYEALYRFTRFSFWSIAALRVLPSVGAMIDHVVNDKVDIVMHTQWHYALMQVTLTFSIIPIYYDLCGRRDMHWTTVVHHVATCFCTVVSIDWDLGVAISVYHCMTCFFVLPLDVALGLCAIEAAPATCVRWLTMAKYTGSVVYVLAQIGILPSLWKLYKQYEQAHDPSLSVQVAFALAVLIDLTLVATQVHLVSVVHGMAERRRHVSSKKQA